MDSQGEQRLFGRFTREECGLPPAGSGLPGWKRRVLGFLSLFAFLIAAGWLGGTLTARWREAWMADLPALVARAPGPEVSGLMNRGRLYATALPRRPGVARNLAVAALVAAERSPRRLGYFANAANLFSGGSGVMADDFGAQVTAAGVYAELGDYPRAFAALDRADAIAGRETDPERRRSLRLLLVNAQAYFLATAPGGGNPEKALHLAQLLVTSRDRLPGGGYASGSAAFVDTLAAAYYATGNVERAVATQRMALGLADSGELHEYLRHYDDFASRSSLTP